jgi:RNA methyltransferase, TrmH family
MTRRAALAIEKPTRRKPGARHQRTVLRVCGLAAVTALFARDPERVERLFFEPRLRTRASDFCAVLARARKPYREVAAPELARVAGTVLHGGIAAIARPRPFAAFDPLQAPDWARDGKPILVLDGIGNPHNLGAIARIATFFGIERMVLADRPEQALPSDAAYRVAEGGFEHLTLYQEKLTKVLPAFRETYRVIGAVLGRGIELAKFAKDKPAVIVLGNEESGIEPPTLACCQEIVTIPGSGNVQSLNVAAAAAILSYALTHC